MNETEKPAYVRVVLKIQLPDDKHEPFACVEVGDPAQLLEWEVFPMKLEDQDD